MNEQSPPIAASPGDRRSAVSRRLFLAALPVALAGCASGRSIPVAALVDPRKDPQYVSMYGAVPDERFPLPAIDLRQVDPVYYRRQVDYASPERVGTLVVDPYDKFLYLVQPEGRAMRYGIGVGRDGFDWNGRAQISRKAAWPTWTPPAEMIARDPKTAQWARGMPPGLDNPLGARALYLYQNGRDTLYRIHGTNEPWTIGSNVSSGCIRMINQDALDLFGRVPIGSEVVVLGSSGAVA